MKNLKFDRLVLVSSITKSANQFTFQKRFNLITGKDNTIGKSTLVKCIFWSLGCEPELDDTWKQLDCKVLLEFSIDSKKLKVLRTSNSIYFSESNNNYEKFDNVTGKFAVRIAELVGFKAKLKKRLKNEELTPVLEVPPPAFYFLPFYIDQKLSWTQPWNSFTQLGQYKNWKPLIVKYHTGYLSPEYFDIEEEVIEYEAEKNEANEEITRISTAIEIVEKYVPKNNTALTSKQYERITDEIQEELAIFSREQEDLFEKLTKNQSSKYHFENQLRIAEIAISEIDKDYQFSVENIDNDDIECPLCGTEHDNSIVSRASILSDKQEIEKHIGLINKEILLFSQNISKYEPRLENVKNRIEEINNKYIIETENNQYIDLPNIIDSFASQSVQKYVAKTRIDKEAIYKNREDRQKDLKKDQKKLLSKTDRDELSSQFMGLLEEFLLKLNAKEINLNKIKHPTDYNKLFRSGGAAEGTRAALAYQIAIYRMIVSSANETPSSIVIDTPNQQDQANINYQSIIRLIMEDIPSNSQVILCAMENTDIEPYLSSAKVIELDKNKLLNKEMYEKLDGELSSIIENVVSST